MGREKEPEGRKVPGAGTARARLIPARNDAARARLTPAHNEEHSIGNVLNALLAQIWVRWQVGYDYVAGIDADTILASDCLQQLEADLAVTLRPGGVTAR